VTRPVDATRGVLLTAGLIGSTFVLVVILALVLPIRILILDYRMENFFVSDNVPLSAAFLKVFWIQGLILLTGWAGGAFWLALLRLRQVSAVQAWLEAMGTTLVLMLAGNSLFMLLALLSFAHPNGINISFGGNPFFGRSLPFFFNSAFWISNVIAALVLGSLGFLFALGAASWSQVRQPGQSSTFVRDYARIVPATFLVMLATLLITYWYGDRIANSIALLGLPLIGLSAWAHCDVMRVLRRDQPALFAPQPSATPPGVPVKANAAMPFAIAAIALLGVAVLGFFVLPRVTAGVINSSFNLFTNNAGQLLIYSIIAIAMMLVALGLSIAYLAVINRAGMRGLRLGLAIGGLAATVIALIAAVWYDHV
ncbi:MAG TPA: hypothetical protein VKB76_11700, partial [Ktedonobacterales bacterium]|nr:hypothetical protein [Ktedonobacterales bacterium]